MIILRIHNKTLFYFKGGCVTFANYQVATKHTLFTKEQEVAFAQKVEQGDR